MLIYLPGRGRRATPAAWSALLALAAAGCGAAGSSDVSGDDGDVPVEDDGDVPAEETILFEVPSTLTLAPGEVTSISVLVAP